MSATAQASATELPPEGPWYTHSPDEVAAGFDVVAGRGLSHADAAKRLEKYGPNAFAATATEPRWKAFVRQYRDPMQIVLLVAGIGSIWPLHELPTGLVIIFLTLFNAVLGLRQEGEAAQAVAAAVSPESTTTRTPSRRAAETRSSAPSRIRLPRRMRPRASPSQP